MYCGTKRKVFISYHHRGDQRWFDRFTELFADQYEIFLTTPLMGLSSSRGARREAERADAVPVALMNGEQLVLLLAEHEVGVSRRAHEMPELAEDNHIEAKD